MSVAQPPPPPRGRSKPPAPPTDLAEQIRQATLAHFQALERASAPAGEARDHPKPDYRLCTAALRAPRLWATWRELMSASPAPAWTGFAPAMRRQLRTLTLALGRTGKPGAPWNTAAPLEDFGVGFAWPTGDTAGWYLPDLPRGTLFWVRQGEIYLAVPTAPPPRTASRLWHLGPASEAVLLLRPAPGSGSPVGKQAPFLDGDPVRQADPPPLGLPGQVHPRTALAVILPGSRTLSLGYSGLALGFPSLPEEQVPDDDALAQARLAAGSFSGDAAPGGLFLDGVADGAGRSGSDTRDQQPVLESAASGHMSLEADPDLTPTSRPATTAWRPSAIRMPVPAPDRSPAPQASGPVYAATQDGDRSRSAQPSAVEAAPRSSGRPLSLEQLLQRTARSRASLLASIKLLADEADGWADAADCLTPTQLAALRHVREAVQARPPSDDRLLDALEELADAGRSTMPAALGSRQELLATAYVALVLEAFADGRLLLTGRAPQVGPDGLMAKLVGRRAVQDYERLSAPGATLPPYWSLVEVNGQRLPVPHCAPDACQGSADDVPVYVSALTPAQAPIRTEASAAAATRAAAQQDNLRAEPADQGSLSRQGAELLAEIEGLLPSELGESGIGSRLGSLSQLGDAGAPWEDMDVSEAGDLGSVGDLLADMQNLVGDPDS